MRIFDRINFDTSNLNFAQKIAIANVFVFLIYRLSFLFKLEGDFLDLFSLSSNFMYTSMVNNYTCLCSSRNF